MFDPTLTLSESARQALAQLEREWHRSYSRAGKGKGWRSFALVTSLQRKGICQSELHAWQVLDELGRAELIELPLGVRLSPHCKLPVRVELAVDRKEAMKTAAPSVDTRLALTASQHTAWLRALEGPLGDWNADDQLALAECLERLAADLPAAYRWSPYVASARYLLGSSKLLESLPSELVRAFGIEPASFRSAESWLLACIPAAPEGLLLVENAQSFTQACAVGFDQRLAIVCTFGYGLSLCRALDDIDRVRLVGQGVADFTLSDLLRLPDPTYWGDLDPEGLRIFRQLRCHLPSLRLSALYRPMIEALEATRGHPLHVLTGKEGQQQISEWRRGLDQEWLDDNGLATLAGHPLDSSLEAYWMALLETRE